MLRRVISILLIGCILFSNNAIGFCSDEEQINNDQLVVQRYYNVIFNMVMYRSGLGEQWADWVAKTILYLAGKWGVDPFLITAAAAKESNFQQWVYSDGVWVLNVSPAGAIGIGQLMPLTAAQMGYKPEDPAENLEGLAQYLAQQLATFRDSGEWQATYAIAAYNAGPNAVKKFGGIPPYDETLGHVIGVGEIYNQLIQDYYQQP